MVFMLLFFLYQNIEKVVNLLFKMKKKWFYFIGTSFRGEKVSRKWLKNVKTRNFLPANVCTNKINNTKYRYNCCFQIVSITSQKVLYWVLKPKKHQLVYLGEKRNRPQNGYRVLRISYKEAIGKACICCVLLFNQNKNSKLWKSLSFKDFV